MGNKNNYYFNVGDTFSIGDNIYTIRNRKITSLKNNKWKREYLCECTKCKNEMWKNEKYIKRCIKNKNFIKGKGCNKCKGKEKAIARIGIDDIATTHPWLVKYFKNSEDAKLITYGSGQYKDFKCPICGEEKTLTVRQVVRNNGINCSLCSHTISYPNRFGYAVLSQLNLSNFSREYTPTWGQGKRYDFSFYINDKHFLVEMDGSFHFESGFNNKVKLEDTQKNDVIKTKLANENCCILVRIDCKKSNFEYIKNNFIDSSLKNIIDLNKINWKQVKQDVASNLQKDVCNYYMTHKNNSLEKIGEIFGVHSTTIRKYLKKGRYIGISDYKTTKEIYNYNHSLILKYAKAHPNDTVKNISKALGMKEYLVRNHLKKAALNNEIKVINNYYDIKKKKTIQIIKKYPNATKKFLCEKACCSNVYLNNCIKEINNV